ncbi:MAG TPA: ribose-phosphate pyrophosphokinase [Gammaproteobacteria bacterium]|nr:ribose-phosphate pyrophosphokinase [Gammaproteobacteria bacterium]
MQSDDMIVFTGSANPDMAVEVCDKLELRLGKAVVSRFSDGEIQVELLENVRGKDVFILQSICPPCNDHLMELLLLMDACKRSAAARITAVVPYLGYSRQDRRPRSQRTPISARLVADMISIAGADHVVTVDIHADQIVGFFDIPTDNIYALPVLLGDIWRHSDDSLQIVSPDVGGVVRARALAKPLDADLAIIDKRRPKANVAKVMNIIGDVEGRSCVIIDDLVDTANTLCEAARALKKRGAQRVAACCTHPILSGSAVERITHSELDELVVTNTVPLSDDAAKCPKIRQLSVAELLAETMYRIANEESVSSLFIS